MRARAIFLNNMRARKIKKKNKIFQANERNLDIIIESKKN